MIAYKQTHPDIEAGTTVFKKGDFFLPSDRGPGVFKHQGSGIEYEESFFQQSGFEKVEIHNTELYELLSDVIVGNETRLKGYRRPEYMWKKLIPDLDSCQSRPDLFRKVQPYIYKFSLLGTYVTITVDDPRSADFIIKRMLTEVAATCPTIYVNAGGNQ